MKKFLSSTLLFLFLFNTIGYYLFFLGLRYQARVEMNQRLDAENYTDNETVTFKIPLALPYNIYEGDYERVNGAFEHNGEFLKLVKRKLERDTLYIVCIKDHKEKKLFNVMTDFVKLSNELPAASRQTIKLLGSFSKDFFPSPACDPQIDEALSLCLNYGSQRFNLINNHLPVFSPPPDL